MLVLRLQRTGRKNLPTYRIVVAEKARPVKGKFLDIVGHYLPAGKSTTFKIEKEKIEQWIAKGAAPSDTLARLLKKEGLKNMDKFIQRYTKQRSKSAPAEEPAAAPVAEASPKTEEAPATETAPAATETSGDTPANS